MSVSSRLRFLKYCQKVGFIFLKFKLLYSNIIHKKYRHLSKTDLEKLNFQTNLTTFVTTIYCINWNIYKEFWNFKSNKKDFRVTRAMNKHFLICKGVGGGDYNFFFDQEVKERTKIINRTKKSRMGGGICSQFLWKPLNVLHILNLPIKEKVARPCFNSVVLSIWPALCSTE